jgi:hypothetical protein
VKLAIDYGRNRRQLVHVSSRRDINVKYEG